ncbi:MAG TPA: type II toxin-antitoxin system VapC family toxin [Methylomirabilota bacterium]|nr:type II toxin-antitoxin system VapC family toxin [Methylomirabilota bacterium]
MIVLDTHAWLWLCLEPRRLSGVAATAIRRAANDGGLAVASITLWEVAMMIVRGRVIPQGTPEAWLGALVDRSGVTVKEITPSVAALATHFPDDFPADPADRLIAATARADGVPLVSRDARLRASPVVETIW